MSHRPPFVLPRVARLAALVLASLGCLLAPAGASAATFGPGPAGDYDPGPATYGMTVERDLPIVLRDGVTLRADVYRPTDLATGAAADGPFPVILSETPYGKQLSVLGGEVNELTGLEPELVKRGYVQAIVDVRGSGGSGGSFDLLSPTEQQDSVEVIDWAGRLPATTGKVGMVGLSYVAITQLLAAEAVAPGSPLKAIFPMMATNDPYRELAGDGGLFNLASIPPYAAALDATTILSPGAQTPRAPLDGIALTAEHGVGSTYWSANTLGEGLAGGDAAYDGSYWRARSPGAHLDKIVKNGVAAFLIGGSYDVFQTGEILNFVGLQNAAAGKAASGPLQTTKALDPRYQLLFGPWYHLAHFDEFDLHQTQLAWFDHWLKGKETGITDTTKPLHVIEPGGARYDTDRLPLRTAKSTKLYLGDETLSERKPTSLLAEDRVAFSAAGLTCNRATEQWYTGLPNTALNMLGLQDPCAENRPTTERSLGQRSYTTAPLDQDTRLAGPGTLSLQATATTRDAEFVVTLQDVDASGKATDLTAGALLGSHRAVDDGLSWPGAGGDPLFTWHPLTKAAKKPVVPGRLTRFDVPLRPVFATLPAGHRLRVVIATSELPHLVAIPADLVNLVGGTYDVQRNVGAASFLQVSLSDG